ncbi:5-oxoprolinase (hydantoinase B/oxoprolinase) [Fusarium oxysporum f. sp. phaseoli]
MTRPYKMKGGVDRKSGVNYIVKAGEVIRCCRVGGRKDFKVEAGDWFVIDTPGGGAWGDLPARSCIRKRKPLKRDL